MAMLNRQKHINALNRVALVATLFFYIRYRSRPLPNRRRPGASAEMPAGREQGFVLVLTLVVILALSIATEFMTRWVSSALDHALANRQKVEARRQLDEAAALARYILATRPLSLRWRGAP